MAMTNTLGAEDNSLPSLRETTNPLGLSSDDYDNWFDPPLRNDFECVICRSALREPVETPCGHIYCEDCILRSIRDVGSICPMDMNHLNESQLNPDNFARREIRSHPVFCRLKKVDECSWKGPLSMVEDHLKECDFGVISCPKNCGTKFQRIDLKKHLEDDCPNRTSRCSFCTEEISWNSMENHLLVCPHYPLRCEECGMSNIRRNEMQGHKSEECRLNFQSSSSQGRSYPAVSEALQQIEQPGLQGPQSGSRGAVEAQKQLGQPLSQQTEFDQMKHWLRELNDREERNYNELLEENGKLRRQVERLQLRVDVLQATQEFSQQQKTEIDGKLKAKMESLECHQKEFVMRVETQFQENTHKTNCLDFRMFALERRIGAGRTICWIHGCQQRRLDAINGIATVVDSPSFFSGLDRYMLCLRIYFNGVDRGVGKYFGLFAHLMKGPYDENLNWPFAAKIKLCILDQSQGAGPFQHITCQISNYSMSACQRPTAPVNAEGFGHVEFAPIAQICQPPYIKDDTIGVSIEIKWCNDEE